MAEPPPADGESDPKPKALNPKKGKTVSFNIKEKEQEKGPENEEQLKMPNFSVLDTKPSHVLDFPLTVTHQLWMIFFLPTLATLLIYIVDIATDIGMGLAFISEQDYVLGGVTLALLYLPALVMYFIRLSSPPDTNDLKIGFTWLLIETGAFILFPIRVLQCMGERLFWSIEAMRQGDPDQEDALVEFEATRSHVVDNYLFLQAYLQAGPQAILQAVLLFNKTSKFKDTQIVEGVCVIASLLTVALVTSAYQRYETQVRGGRHQVWKVRERSSSILLLPEGEIQASSHRRWIKVMEEDNPIGRLISFSFWFLFLFARLLALVTASLFFPYTVLAMCAVHYLFNLIYILPSPSCTAFIPTKTLLAALYVFCLVEVQVPFRKSSLLYTFFFTFSILEDLGVTILWALWAEWSGTHYYYTFYILAACHVLALLFLFFYFKYFQPPIKRLEPM